MYTIRATRPLSGWGGVRGGGGRVIGVADLGKEVEGPFLGRTRPGPLSRRPPAAFRPKHPRVTFPGRCLIAQRGRGGAKRRRWGAGGLRMRSFLVTLRWGERGRGGGRSKRPTTQLTLHSPRDAFTPHTHTRTRHPPPQCMPPPPTPASTRARLTVRAHERERRARLVSSSIGRRASQPAPFHSPRPSS